MAGTLFNNGVDHTEDAHLVERFALADPNTLVVTQQFTDPGSFAGTAARVLSFSRGQITFIPTTATRPTGSPSIRAKARPHDERPHRVQRVRTERCHGGTPLRINRKYSLVQFVMCHN